MPGESQSQRPEVSDAVVPPERAAGRVLVGTQGFSYDQWEGLVYPVGLPRGRRVAEYARQFALVELDSTYYGTPRPAQVLRWAELTPETFTFTAKVPKQVTQEARLAGDDARRELARFLETIRLLGPRLGPVLFQMSPGFRYPRDFPALRETLRHLDSLGGEGLRFAVEFRHPSWLGEEREVDGAESAAAEGQRREEPADLLRRYGVAWVWNDWYPTEDYLEQMPRAIDVPAAQRITSDSFGYIRLTGNHAECIDYRTVRIDRTSDLERWARLALDFRRDREDRSVYVLLNNHYAGSSPNSVRHLEHVLGVPVRAFPAFPDGAPEPPRLPGL
ncbi:MAG: DUF72 domain-containing protein [Chloroflexota bacterium]|nr:DUF72 domain-containing protein [Chloroflexota bacterium]